MGNKLIEVDDAVVYSVPSKEKVKELTDRLYSVCENGLQNPLDLLTKLKFADKVITDTIQQIMPMAITEASKHEKNFRFNNFELNVQESGVKYDYTKCNHPRWNELNKDLEKIKAEMKGIEMVIKANKTKYTYVDETTGEVFDVFPPTKKSTTTVACELK